MKSIATLIASVFAASVAFAQAPAAPAKKEEAKPAAAAPAKKEAKKRSEEGRKERSQEVIRLSESWKEKPPTRRFLLLSTKRQTVPPNAIARPDFTM